MDSRNTGNNTETDTSTVAVIADQVADQQLVTRLLLNAGYHAGLVEGGASLKPTNAEHSATIVCHRRSSTLACPVIPTSPDGQRVVVLSDCSAEQTVVQALEKGAHHFFDLTETPAVLQARLEAALRQHSIQAKKILDVEPFKFNLERRNVYLNGKLVNLSPKEYEFAYYLFANRHRVVVNAELMTSVWSLPSTMDARRIDTAACRVRKKMQLDDSSQGWSLRRIRRVGYELLWCGPDIHDTDIQNTENRPVATQKRLVTNAMETVVAPKEETAQNNEKIRETA